MRRLIVLGSLLWLMPAFATPLDNLGPAKSYVEQAIDLLALPSGDCEKTCQLRSLVKEASITYGKLNDKDYAAVFFTVRTNKGDREMALLMRIDIEDFNGGALARERANAIPHEHGYFNFSKPQAFRVAAVGPQIDGGKPNEVFFSDEEIIFKSTSSPNHRLEQNEKGILISKVIAPSYVGSKLFKVERESVYPAGTENAVTLGMPFSMDSIKNALPGRLTLSFETLEGVETISTALGHSKDAGSIEIYAKDGKVDGIEVGNNAESALGVRIGAPALSVPGLGARDCDMDDLSGDYICRVKPEPYFYRLDFQSCPTLPKNEQWPAKPKSIACMKVIGISIGNTRM